MGMKEKLLEAALEIAAADAAAVAARARYDLLYTQAMGRKAPKKSTDLREMAMPPAEGEGTARTGMKTIKDRVLQFLAAHPQVAFKHGRIAEAIGAKPGSVRFALNQALTEGLVLRPRRGSWKHKGLVPVQREIALHD